LEVPRTQGIGGNRYGEKSEMHPYQLVENVPDAPGQLYNLETDPGETTNLYNEQPEIVAELTALLQKSIDDGRSVPE